MEPEQNQNEWLLLRSLDATVSPAEQQQLARAMQEEVVLRRHHDQYLRIRNAIQRTEPDTFGPFFAERIMHMISQRKQDLDFQLFFFFKKYQVLIAGIIVALLIVNLMLSDEFSIAGIFGLDKGTDQDIFSIDINDNLPD
ncbi:MAG: hypothetical protein MUE95_02645 [Cyclobacteriaceae bacterium]|jgi:hypothetical protein|nr:hypothetical protein [Cyclobacteriaceae bacterium]